MSMEGRYDVVPWMARSVDVSPAVRTKSLKYQIFLDEDDIRGNTSVITCPRKNAQVAIASLYLNNIRRNA